MRTFCLALTAAMIAGPALATPLSDALDAAPEGLCYTRVEPAPHGQSWKKVTLSFAREGFGDGAPTLRLNLQGRGKPVLVTGACSWSEGEINRGAGGRVLDTSFLPTSGVTCFMSTDVTGASAEEGGSFPIDWADGQTLEVHLPVVVAAWRSYDTRHAATWPDVAAADRIVRVQRTTLESCAELRARFAPPG
jgi:hypothetical protein